MRSRSTVSVIHGLLRSNCRSWVDMVRAADSVEQDLKVQASCVKQDQKSVPCLLIRYHRSLSDHHFGQLMPYTYYFLSMLPAFRIRMPIREQEGTLKKIMIDKADKLRNRDRKRGSEIMEQQIACWELRVQLDVTGSESWSFKTYEGIKREGNIEKVSLSHQPYSHMACALCMVVENNSSQVAVWCMEIPLNMDARGFSYKRSMMRQPDSIFFFPSCQVKLSQSNIELFRLYR